MANSSSHTIEALESSLQHLVANYERRQRWQLVLRFVSGGFCRRRQDQDASYQHSLILRAQWRVKLANFLDSLPTHIATLLLLVVDLALTVLDLSSSLLSCNHGHAKNEANEVYHWIGIAVLSLLSAKVVSLVLALGSCFFKSAGHVVDGLVVVGALILEVVAEGKGTGLLVVASLWRVVRVVESAFEISSEAIEAQIEGVLMQFEVIRAENRRLEEVLVEKDERIKQLEEELASTNNTYITSL